MMLTVSNFLCECLAVMLGAESDDRTRVPSETPDQPEMAGKDVIDRLTDINKRERTHISGRE
jgi:hypothetical protein